jgi:ABC-2 type transport system ATP-binding protein
VIEISKLSFSYPGSQAPALQDLSLSVRQGSLFGLLGPNGSGKTTLISILSGLIPAPKASARIRGMDLSSQLPKIQPLLGLVPQDYAFYPSLSVAENLEFFAGVQKLPSSLAKQRISEVLSLTELEAAKKKKAHALSGGMKRRLNIAIGLLNRPKLLFLDEPTVGIDPQSRAFILESVRRINAQGCTVVYTTHYMEEVEAICDEIGVLDRGHLLLQGSLRKLLSGRDGGMLQIGLGKALPAAIKKALAPMAKLGLRVSASSLSMEQCPSDLFSKITALLAAKKISLTRVKYGFGNLEELFLHLTKRNLRD